MPQKADLSSLAAEDKTFRDAVISTVTVNDMDAFTPSSGAMFTVIEYVAGTDGNLDLMVTGVQNMSDALGVDVFFDAYRRLFSGT